MAALTASAKERETEPGVSGYEEVASLGGNRFWRRFRRNRLALAAGAFLLFLLS